MQENVVEYDSGWFSGYSFFYSTFFIIVGCCPFLGIADFVYVRQYVAAIGMSTLFVFLATYRWFRIKITKESVVYIRYILPWKNITIQRSDISYIFQYNNKIEVYSSFASS